MAQLRRDYREFVKRDAEVIAIAPDSEQEFNRWWQRHKMPFPGIADPEHQIASRYGQQAKMLRLGRMPEVIVVDKEGNMRLKRRGKEMSDIPTDKEVLALLDDLEREARRAKK